MHMHTREQSFACTYESCRKSFCDRDGLIQHENSHTRKNLQLCDYESFNQTFTKPFQLHRHYHAAREKTVASVEEFRPIRLRLSQPKRKGPESLLMGLPTKTTFGGPSQSDPADAYKPCSELETFTKRPTNRIERNNVHHDTRLSNSSSSISSTLEASGRYQVSGRGFKPTPTAGPYNPAPNVRPQVPVSQLIAKSTSAEKNDNRPDTDEKSSGHGTSVYTRVCGVYSREIASPKKLSTQDGSYHCPRCDKQFTRARGVMRHFVGCITKYGNPDSLKWTDHPSLQGTVKFHARKEHQGLEDVFLPRVADVRGNKENSREFPKDALLRSLKPKPQSSVAEENRVSVEPVYKPSGRNALLQKDVVRPIDKRRDALRRSKYNPETISRDVLLAMGSHPSMDPLNAHLDIIRKRFRAVNLESNMSTFRWDLVDPEQSSEQEPEGLAEQEVAPEQSPPKPSEANDVQWYYDAPSPFPSRLSTEPAILYNEVPFRVFMPEETHFGPMSTVFSSVFDRDPSARLMSVDRDLWAAIFTMLERGHHGQNFVIRTAVNTYTGDVIGWVACHELETRQAKPVDPSAYLDWTTAAHLLPSQISRFTATKERAEEKAERLTKSKISQGLASTIQARATEAQNHIVPIYRLVINALVVHPLHQGRGVASALLNSVLEVAEMKKIPVWVQAPEDPAVAQGVFKAGLFRRAGFTCAGELNLDLNSYASGRWGYDKEKGVTFGMYKWNYMLRWPQSVVPKPITEHEMGMEPSVPPG